MKPFSEAVFAKEGSLSDTKVPVLPMLLAETKIFTQIRSEMIAKICKNGRSSCSCSTNPCPSTNMPNLRAKPKASWHVATKAKKAASSYHWTQGIPTSKRNSGTLAEKMASEKKTCETVKPKPYISRSFKKQIQLQRLALAIKVPSFQHMSSKITSF